MNKMKRMFAGILVFVMVVAGIVVIPTQADAAVAEDKVIYTEYSADEIKSNYWKDDGNVAPIMAGYVFGGWFQSVTEQGDTTETYTDGTTDTYYDPLTDVADVTEKAYAKFVPAQVLSIKAQNTEGTSADSYNADVRVITSLDSRNYEKVGFDIWLANKNKLYKDDLEQTPLETSNIYKGVMQGETPIDAVDIFGGVSQYVSVWQLGKIAKAHFGKIIYVRPYWITKDGTKVEGFGKYVHVEDEYKGYISVPVNITRTKDSAAGTVVMSYSDFSGLQPAKDDNGNVLFEQGRIFPNMTFHPDEQNKTISMVGHETTVGTYSGSSESIYANIRFVKPTSAQDTILNFELNQVKFCDWNENVLENDNEVNAWDTIYQVKASQTTGE